MAMDLAGLKDIRHDVVKMAYIISLPVLALFAYILIVKIDIGDIIRLRQTYEEAGENLRLSQKIAEYRTFVNEFNSVYTANKDTNWLIEVLNKLAAKESIVFDAIRPSPLTTIAEYRIIRVMLEGQAPYIDILKFINALENYEKCLFIEELQLFSKEERPDYNRIFPSELTDVLPGMPGIAPVYTTPGPAPAPLQEKAAAKFRLVVAFLNAG